MAGQVSLGTGLPSRFLRALASFALQYHEPGRAGEHMEDLPFH